MRRIWLCTTAAILGAGAALGAQAQTLQPGQSSEPPRPSSTGQNTAVGEVVVTGSRLQTTILTSPSPIVAVTSTQLEQAGTDNLERTLIQLPSIGTGLSDTNSENFYAEAGLNLVDLRHLGYNRTLVLVNGRRQVPGDVYTEAVDLNSIPAPLVDRVEVVTGGASAVYGADAVSGVINIILKDHYEGLDVRLRGGISGYGDDGQYGVSFLAGKNFANDRGNVTLSFAYDHTDGVNALARPWGRNAIGYFLNPNTGPGQPTYLTVDNVRYAGINQLGFIGPIGGAYYTPINNGSAVRPYDPGSLGVDANGTQVGGDGGYFRPYDNLSLPLTRFDTALNFNWRISGHAEFFFEGRWADSLSSTRWQPAADFQYGEFQVSASNPYVPANLLPLLAAAGQNSFYYGREYDAFGRRGADNDRFTHQYTAGVKGDLLDGRFKYTVFAGYGQTWLDSNLVGGRDQTKFLQSVDVINLNGTPVCADPAARAAGCQPLNPFNPTATPAGIAYSSVGDFYSAEHTLAQAGANITGDLFNLWAGPVSAVLGVEARRETAHTEPSAAAQDGNIQLFFEQPESGHTNVGEVYGELRVPLLRNLPLVHDLSFQGAARYSDYNVNGGHVSWNVGGIYSPVESINFRVMRSRSVRAPNVDELYSTESQSFENLNDPCSSANISINPNRAANCAALGIPPTFNQTSSSKATYTGGNPNLDVETSDTWTWGVTVAPKYIPHLSLTLDWFDINLTKAIGALDAQTLLDDCVDLAISVTSNPACAAITRDPTTFQVTGVYSINQNIGRLYTRGIDFNVTYDRPLQDLWSRLPGRLTLNATGTYLERLRQFTNASDPTTELQYEGFLGLPKWRVLGTATYAWKRLAVTWRLQFLGSTSVATNQLTHSPLPANLFDKPQTGAEVYNDLSVAYQIDPKTNFRVNIDNIFNNSPPARADDINEGISYGSPYGTASIYPNLGITFSVVLDHKF